MDHVSNCGDRCEEDGDEQWHGSTFSLGHDGTTIALAVHSSGTVEVISTVWVHSPNREALTALVSDFVAAVASCLPIAERNLEPISHWVVGATRKEKC